MRGGTANGYAEHPIGQADHSGAVSRQVGTRVAARKFAHSLDRR